MRWALYVSQLVCFLLYTCTGGKHIELLTLTKWRASSSTVRLFEAILSKLDETSTLHKSNIALVTGRPIDPRGATVVFLVLQAEILL